jgi:vacuolar-type H+-ATPase subunit I/STV1
MAVFMIIVATEFSFRQNISQNHDTAATMLNSGMGYIITNVDFAYSTLLFIAGLSAAYSLYKIDSFKDMFKSILSKLVRLWPVLALFTLIAYGISESIIGDPLIKIWEQKNTIDCPAIFWRKWFLINPLIL